MEICRKCGNHYEGKRCPACGYVPEGVPKSEGVLYGPPPIPRPVVYGPPPIDREIDPKPQPVIQQPVLYGPPPAKRFSCSLILLAVGALLAGLIAWLMAGCSHTNQSSQPTVYGPPPVDTTQTTSPEINE